MHMENPSNPAPRRAAAPAHAGWRVAALIYDALPVIPLVALVSGFFLLANGGHTVEKQPLLQWLALLAYVAVVGGYFVLSWQRGGQTMGMRPWRLRVVAADGSPARAGALWLRFGVACITPVFGLAWALFDTERRALYDIAAKTAFVRLEAMPKKS